MIITIITWVTMWLIFVTYGIGINSVIKKVAGYKSCGIYDIYWFGITFVTVYAQYFSLCYKVGIQAFFLIVLGAICLVMTQTKEFILVYQNTKFQIKKNKIKTIVWGIGLIAIVFIAGVFTIQTPTHYDTYLYHAQNLRWIEEYGVVKGLGNLHNRFAYNSAFMCLQALFSFKWCLGQSLHTVNGLLWVIMLSYAVGTLKVFNKKKVFLSDIFKFLIVMYLFDHSITETLSSPHTDMMTMLLVIYIITRWIELIETKENNYIPYGLLCLLGVFAVSVKLSAALVLILVIKPAICLLKEKKWKSITGFVLIGGIIIVPFLVRNVILSGYLVYPYAEIDFFNVDWKMPASQVVFDNHEIIAWGRMLNDVNRYAEPITIWLPIWLEKSGNFNKVLMLSNLCILPIMVMIVIYNIYKKKYDLGLIIATCCILFGGWLLSAPLPRYGLIYMYLQPLVLLFIVASKIPNNILRGWKYLMCICLIFVIIKMLPNSTDELVILKYGNRLYPLDYKEYSVKEKLWNNITIYLPDGGDQVSYNKFPSTPYGARLELIELRGSNLDEGFKIKDEYKGRKISTYGRFLD